MFRKSSSTVGGAKTGGQTANPSSKDGTIAYLQRLLDGQEEIKRILQQHGQPQRSQQQGNLAHPLLRQQSFAVAVAVGEATEAQPSSSHRDKAAMNRVDHGNQTGAPPVGDMPTDAHMPHYLHGVSFSEDALSPLASAQAAYLPEKFNIPGGVMISMNVKTQKKSADTIAAALRKRGVEVWMCTDLSSGAQFRDEIVRILKKCRVFLPLINNEWAASGECRDEFSFARRSHLTSHEKGRTNPDTDPRLPGIVPISFPGLDWEKHPHVELLAASTHFLQCPGPQVTDDQEAFISMILLSIYNFHVHSDETSTDDASVAVDVAVPDNNAANETERDMANTTPAESVEEAPKKAAEESRKKKRKKKKKTKKVLGAQKREADKEGENVDNAERKQSSISSSSSLSSSSSSSEGLSDEEDNSESEAHEDDASISEKLSSSSANLAPSQVAATETVSQLAGLREKNGHAPVRALFDGHAGARSHNAVIMAPSVGDSIRNFKRGTLITTRFLGTTSYVQGFGSFQWVYTDEMDMELDFTAGRTRSDPDEYHVSCNMKFRNIRKEALNKNQHDEEAASPEETEEIREMMDAMMDDDDDDECYGTEELKGTYNIATGVLKLKDVRVTGMAEPTWMQLTACDDGRVLVGVGGSYVRGPFGRKKSDELDSFRLVAY